MLLVETPCDVQASVKALATEVEPHFVRAVLALVAAPLDGI